MLTPEDFEQLAGIIDAAERSTAEAIAKGKDETIESMRGIQTEILRGIEAFARSNFARMHRLETSNAATVEQLAALEERVFRLETRQRPNQ